jgi:sarcosine oxidase
LILDFEALADANDKVVQSEKIQMIDVIIVGLGAMGSAAAYHLAKRGVKVLGLDLFAPPHTMGSTHGQSRIIREAYFEHPLYVPIVQRAYELWAELAASFGQTLLLETGGLMIGPPDGVVVKGARTSAETHKLRHEVITSEEVHQRFPALNPPADMVSVWEPRAGVLFPELCVRAHLEQAALHQAVLQYNEPVTSWKQTVTGVEVQTTKSSYTSKHLIISAGSWVKEFVPELPVTIERQALVWFEPSDPQLFKPDRCPIFLCEYEPHRYFYGFPDLGTGVKLAVHHEGQPIDPNSANREVPAEEIISLYDVVHPFFPKLSHRAVSATACLYTNMPDEHFLIDWHPSHASVLVCSPCSGHGFKFSAAIGEIVADLILQGSSRFDLEPFRFRGAK